VSDAAVVSDVAVVAVEVVDVHKAFDHGRVPVLRGVNLTVARGELVAITGASGAGKSTLLHLLAALDVPDRGRIVVAGRDLSGRFNANAYRRGVIGLVFQLHNLLAHLDAAENVELAMFGAHRSLAERRQTARDLLGAVGLAGKEHRRPPQLSGGERQRVAIARALANDPAVVLADEPTGNLEPDSAGQVLGLLRRVRDERDVTVILVTHDRDVAATADRTLTMANGTL